MRQRGQRDCDGTANVSGLFSSVCNEKKIIFMFDFIKFIQFLASKQKTDQQTVECLARPAERRYWQIASICGKFDCKCQDHGQKNEQKGRY